MKVLKIWQYFIAAPATALSVLGLIELLEFKTGVGALQFLDVVNSIVNGWNYLHGEFFVWLDKLLPIEFHVSVFERNLAIITVGLMLPISVGASLGGYRHGILRLHQKRFAWGAVFVTLTVVLIGIMILGLYLLSNKLLDEKASDATSLVWPFSNEGQFALFVLFSGIACATVFKEVRSFMVPLLFALVFIVSLELIRLIPFLGTHMDAIQLWLDSLPADQGN